MLSFYSPPRRTANSHDRSPTLSRVPVVSDAMTIGTVLRSRLDTKVDEYRANLAADAGAVGHGRRRDGLACRRSAGSATSTGITPATRCSCANGSNGSSTRTRRCSSLSPLAAWGTQDMVGAGIGQRHRRRREHARRDQRHRHDLPRRVGEPDELAEAATLLRDRQGEPAPADPAQRVGRCRSAPPGRPVHPGRGQLPRPHPDVEDGHPARSRSRSGRTRPAAPTRRG